MMRDDEQARFYLVLSARYNGFQTLMEWRWDDWTLSLIVCSLSPSLPVSRSLEGSLYGYISKIYKNPRGEKKGILFESFSISLGRVIL